LLSLRLILAQEDVDTARYRIEASPENQDATAMEIRRERVEEAIRELAPSAASVEHE
jgi:hypothetical protein